MLSGAANRILVLAERQSSHRLRQEASDRNAFIAARTRGQWFAFVVAMSGLGLGGYLVTAGMPWIGSVPLLAALGELALTIYARFRQLQGGGGRLHARSGAPPESPADSHPKRIPGP